MNSHRSLTLIASLWVSACASHPRAAPPSPVPNSRSDASYDWHGLLVAPFGSQLTDIPAPKVEVLLFDGQSGAPGECYRIDATPPRFLNETPVELTLCYRHDHLARIEATVMLPASEAPQILAEACALWQRNAAAAAAQPTPISDGAAGTCRGRDGEVDFDGRLEAEADFDADRAILPYTLTLDVSDPA